VRAASRSRMLTLVRGKRERSRRGDDGGQLEKGGTRGAAGGPWTAMSVRQEERRPGDGGGQRGFTTIRENIRGRRTRYDTDRMVQLASSLDPTVSGLTGDVALSGAGGLGAGFL
jgi:hypothetical protein